MFLRERVAKELFTPTGKIVVIFIYIVGTMAAFYGCSQVEVDFKMSFFIKEGSNCFNFLTKNEAYFASGFSPVIYIDDPTTDFTSEESQYKLLEFQERLERCYGC